MLAAASWDDEVDDLLPANSPRPVTLETPRPTNDGAYDCTLEHLVEGGYAEICWQCTEDSADALDACGLLYYLVLSTSQANDPFIYGCHFNEKAVYKWIRCGSKEVAAAEAFYTSGVDGWNIAFSCVMREGETFEERVGP